MSFYRVGQPKKKKSSFRRRPGWDDSVNDLTVFKATPEEMYLRKEAHKSKNHISVKLEKLRKERQRSKMSGAEAQQLAIMKEVLYDQHELQKVLAKSDSMMAVVKDLFGDDPKRFMGFPNVTTAPQSDSDPNKSGSLVASVPDIYTRTEKLSDSVMNQSALNDVDSDSESEPDSDEGADQPQPISYQSKLNLQRFQDFLQEEERLNAHMDPPSLVSQLQQKEEVNAYNAEHENGHDQHAATRGESSSLSSSGSQDKKKGQMMHLLASLLNQGKTDQENTTDAKMLNALLDAVAAKKKEEAGFRTPPKHQYSQRIPSERTPPSAINDTKKVKKTKKCSKPTEPHSESINTSASMNGMRQVLQELENEIAAYEHQTGRRPQEESNKTETFSGYTIALVSAVSRLTKYLKETDLRVRTEVTLREQLTQDVYQLRTIIDALATDIIITQEEYGKLYSEHQRFKDNTTAALASINNQVRELRLMPPGKQTDGDTEQPQRPPALTQQQQQDHHPQQLFNVSNSSRKSDDSAATSTSMHNQQDSSTLSGSGSYKPLPAQMRPANSIAAATSAVTASAAVMLSPPVRKTRVQTNTVDPQANNHSKFSQRQTSLVDISTLPRQDPVLSIDPPHLTQTPPVMNTVNVPRPIPLVQTNVNVALPGDQNSTQPPSRNLPTRSANLAQHSQALNNYTSSTTELGAQQGSEHQFQMNGQTTPRGQRMPVSTAASQAVSAPDLTDLVKLGDETEEQLHRLQELAVEEAMNNPALQELMQTQIAELNRQQEEARQRLLDLLDKQKMQQTRIQQHFQDPTAEGSSSPPLGQAQKSGTGCSQISPPISPISQKPEEDQQGRGIIVSLPMVDLDVSGGSLNSPRSSSQPVK